MLVYIRSFQRSPLEEWLQSLGDFFNLLLETIFRDHYYIEFLPLQVPQTEYSFCRVELIDKNMFGLDFSRTYRSI
jgi:hypothetical protein